MRALPMLLGALVSATSAHAGAPVCQGRYVLTSMSSTLPGTWETRAVAVVVDGRKVAIEDVCDTTGGRVRGRREGDRVRVGFTKWRWTTGSASFAGSVDDFYNGTLGRPRLVPVTRCGDAEGVKLEAWISADCATMTGRIRGRTPLFDVEFTAAAE
jgi:hypothetical protein